MTIDLTDTVIPKSDQLNSDDLMTGPRTFTITEVRKTGSPEQPVAIYLAEYLKGRPYKPGKSMLRVLIAAWGKDASVYVGRRLTLYRDPTITFGPDLVGGLRISHLSHIDKRMVIPLTKTRGQKKPFTVEPLGDAPATPPPALNMASPVAKAMFDAINNAGIPDDERLPLVCKAIGRTITSTKEMTEDEARLVLDHLAALEPTVPEQS